MWLKRGIFPSPRLPWQDSRRCDSHQWSLKSTTNLYLWTRRISIDENLAGSDNQWFLNLQPRLEPAMNLSSTIDRGLRCHESFPMYSHSTMGNWERPIRFSKPTVTHHSRFYHPSHFLTHHSRFYHPSPGHSQPNQGSVSRSGTLSCIFRLMLRAHYLCTTFLPMLWFHSIVWYGLCCYEIITRILYSHPMKLSQESSWDQAGRNLLHFHYPTWFPSSSSTPDPVQSVLAVHTPVRIARRPHSWISTTTSLCFTVESWVSPTSISTPSSDSKRRIPIESDGVKGSLRLWFPGFP